MEWPSFIEMVTKLGLTGTLAFIVWTLWRENKTLQAEVKALHEARINDLKSMLRSDD